MKISYSYLGGDADTDDPREDTSTQDGYIDLGVGRTTHSSAGLVHLAVSGNEITRGQC